LLLHIGKKNTNTNTNTNTHTHTNSNTNTNSTHFNRLNTIRRSDAIMVLMNGKIVESGTYDELMNSKHTSYFRDLVELQNLKPTPKAIDSPQSQLDD